jgi:hypothetical protein
MIASAVFITTLIFMSIGIVLLQECQFLIPYRHVLFGTYGDTILVFALALFFNVFAVVYTLCRLFFLKDTGRKLAHLEKQLRTGSSLSEELHDRLSEDA